MIEYSNSQNINSVLSEYKNEPCKYNKVNTTGAIQNFVAIDPMRLWVSEGTSKCFEENTFKPRCKSCKQQFIPTSSRRGFYQRFCRDAECIKEREKVIRRRHRQKVKRRQNQYDRCC